MEQLVSLPEGQAFDMTWRPEGSNYGRIIRHGTGSTLVRIPKPDGTAWETIPVAPSTEVEPVELDHYNQQVLGTNKKSNKNHSMAEKPVELVHRLCDEMEGATRKEIVESCVAQGVNKNTAQTQYYAWRKKHQPGG